MKVLIVGSDLLHADGQIDIHDEAKSRFSQFCEGAEKRSSRNTLHTQLCIFIRTVSYVFHLTHSHLGSVPFGPKRLLCT